MKKFLFILLTAALTACSSLTPAEKAERQARIAKAVEYALAAKYKILKDFTWLKGCKKVE